METQYGIQAVTSIPVNRMNRMVIYLKREGGAPFLEFRLTLIGKGGKEFPTKKSVSFPVRFYRNFREALFEVDQFLLDYGLVKGEDFGLD